MFCTCALGLLANLKETREVKWACQVEATSIRSVVKGVMVVIPKWELWDSEKVYKMNSRVLRSTYVIVPRCSHGFQDPGHKTPSQGFKILIRNQVYIQEYDMAWYGTSVISELTQWSGSLTRLASDLGQVCQKFVYTIPF